MPTCGLGDSEKNQSNGAADLLVGRREQVRDCQYAHTSDDLRKAGELRSPIAGGLTQNLLVCTAELL
jgi:hypothetical protein